jgi:glycosyltransferase involved in cell wall biosynthesis/2-polyprenyl-3-methyl-5-hydroxy-6-metoxy-1,4-benzoquinol methylase
MTAQGRSGRPRLLIFVVAYNAERTISSVLTRVPAALAADYEVEILVIDDASQDETFARSRGVREGGRLPFPLHVLFNPVNQGYGGNQKIGYHFAIERGFDYVALVHGDGQYAPERLPDLVRPLRDGTADAVFGSRMLERGAALRGGMPFYKFVGNKILTAFQNRMLGTRMSEFHSGYRVYATAALRRIPFGLNTRDFHFDTEIIIQLLRAGQRILELPIPTYYGDELCHVNGLKYAVDVATSVLVARAQSLGLFYDRRFDCESAPTVHAHYGLKTGYLSPHSLALDYVTAGSRILDLGCAGGGVADLLTRSKGCHVTAVDRHHPMPGAAIEEFTQQDLDQGPPALAYARYDYVLMLDVLEHLRSPEEFVEKLRAALKMAPNVRLLVSTANIGFIVNRIMLLLGQFNYGKRGVLDLTHTRLFTFESFRRLFDQGGFRVLESKGIPGPFPLALGDNWLSRILVAINSFLIRLAPGLFSYQVFFAVEPLPSLDYLLSQALEHSERRVETEDTLR